MIPYSEFQRLVHLFHQLARAMHHLQHVNIALGNPERVYFQWMVAYLGEAVSQADGSMLNYS